MAELLAAGAGLGIASSLITFGDVAWRVLKRIKEYSDRTDDIPAVLKHTTCTTCSCRENWRNTTRQRKQITPIHPETALAVALTSCENQITRLDILTKKMLSSESDSRTRRVMKAVSSVYYEREIGRAWAEIETYKTTLILHFTTTTEIVAKFETLQLKSSIFSVPFERDLRFVARTDIMTGIESTLHNQGRISIAGIGGIGKSQIAIEYCYKFSDTYPEAHVFWIHAGTSDRFIQAYNDIARKLLIPGWNDPKINTLQIVYEWFMNEENGRWLLILDNADNMEIFHPPRDSEANAEKENPASGLAHYLPFRSKGSILITTRDATVGRNLTNGKEPLVVQSMTAEEGKAMLLSKLPDSQSENDLENVLVELEYLPLAITQAAAFISQNYINISKYLELLHANDANILNKDFYDWRRDSEATNSMIRTWSLSFDQLRRQKPCAADMLSLMSVLDRQCLYKTLLCAGHENEVDLITAFSTLLAFSLVTVDKGGAVFGMHRLVQTATQKWLELQGALHSWQGEALSLLCENFPFGTYENWTVCETLIPHAQVILKYNFETESSNLQHAELLHNAAFYEYSKGRYKLAEEMNWRALKEREKILGKDHPDTLNIIANLASVFLGQGNYDAAEEMSRRVLTKRETTLGENHLDTLNIVNDLARVFRHQGKYEAAEKMSWRVLKGYEKTLGNDHPDTLTSVDALARVFRGQGKYEAAEKMSWRVLKGYEKTLGYDHPNTLISVHNLGLVFCYQGKYEAAKKMSWRALKRYEKMLGSDHPHTLTSVNNLALIFQYQGKYEAAEKMSWRALRGSEKTLGYDHPNTLTSVHNLAMTFQHQGKHEAAEEMYWRALKGEEKILGYDHPDTFSSVSMLATLYHTQEKYNEASELFQRACEGFQKTLGAEHPHTLMCQRQYQKLCKDIRESENVEEEV